MLGDFVIAKILLWSQALKDVDYMIKEKNLFEKLFDCELESSTINNESKGIFYIDNGHSFDKGK